MTSAEAQALAERVVNGMLARDAFSRWLGIETVEIAPQRSVIRMTVRPEMVNGFGVAHGGIAYSLADSALAFACNTHGTVTVAIDNAINYPRPVQTGDTITATATAEHESNRLGFYRVVVTNQRDELVAAFRGTVYKTPKPHEERAAVARSPRPPASP